MSGLLNRSRGVEKRCELQNWSRGWWKEGAASRNGAAKRGSDGYVAWCARSSGPKRAHQVMRQEAVVRRNEEMVDVCQGYWTHEGLWMW
jgi:hypothetical protein